MALILSKKRFSMTIRLLLGVVAVFAISSTVEAAKSKSEKGTITKVQQDSGKESGSITVKITPKNSKGNTNATTTSEEKTFKITESTKLETTSGKKKDATNSPAKFNDLKEGNGVIVSSNNKKGVESVKITKAKKKKKTNA
ncbi:MAG: hypothetical protein ACKO16_17580 [Gemmataceae bacterium]